MIFGDSGTYKSFITIAMSACIATGRDFYGYPVKKGAVYYIAAEGSMGIIRRFRAWAQENCVNLTNAPLYRYTGAVNLLDAAGILISALDDAVELETEFPALAVIDTWSRALTGDDSDTAAAAEGLHVLDTIRARYPTLAIVIIHHTGHREKNRARGASLIHAAVDSEYKVEKNAAGEIVFANTKSKESELLPPIAFKARGVNILADDGRFLLNEDGEIETSAVLEAVDYTPPVEGLGGNQEKILEILQRQDDKNLTYEDLQEAFKQETGNNKKSNFDQTLKSLEGKGAIYRETGFVCLGKPKNA
jgi:hypothetical protein